MRRSSALAALLAAVLLAPAALRAAAPVLTEEQRVQQALIDFHTALHAGDRAALVRLIWADTRISSQDSARSALVNIMVAQKQLEQAAIARFAEAGERLSLGVHWLGGPGLEQEIRAAEVTLDDIRTSARLRRQGDTGIVRLRRVDGGDWRVVLEPIELEFAHESMTYFQEVDQRTHLRLQRYEQMAAAIAELARSIADGRVEQVGDAEQWLLERLAAIDQEFEQNMRSVPERRRWRRPGW